MPPIHTPNVIGAVQLAASAGAAGEVLKSAGAGVQSVWGHDNHALLSNLLGLSPYHHLPAPTAPAANLLNVAGIINGQTDWQSQVLFSAVNPQPAGTAAAPGTSLTAAHLDHVHAVTAASFATGTFVATFAGTITPGTYTYSSQTGYYTIIGNRLFFNVYVQATARSVAPTGNALITGLPFASNSTANSFSAIAIGFMDQVTFAAANHNYIVADIPAGSTFIQLIEEFGAATYSFQPVAASGLLATAGIVLSGSYLLP